MTKRNNAQGGPTERRQTTNIATKLEARLTDAALILLGAAAGREDGLVLPPPASCLARGRVLEKVLGSLLKAGLVSEVPVAADQQAWRADQGGERIGLEITGDGRRAIGMPASGSDDNATRARPEASTQDEQPSTPPPVNQPGVEEGEPAEAAAASAQPGPQRRTKQVQLIDLLSGPEGRSVAALGKVLGWQAHTVRAALTGLRQKGFLLAKGKDHTGTTVYQIEAGAGESAPAKNAVRWPR